MPAAALATAATARPQLLFCQRRHARSARLEPHTLASARGGSSPGSSASPSAPRMRPPGAAPAAAPAAPAPAYAAEAGAPAPLGPSPGLEGRAGVNFAVQAPHAGSVALCLYDGEGAPLLEAAMHRSREGVWHAFVPGLPQSGVQYGYRVAGEGGWNTPFRWDPARVLLDPYAPLVVGRAAFGRRDAREAFQPKARSVAAGGAGAGTGGRAAGRARRQRGRRCGGAARRASRASIPHQGCTSNSLPGTPPHPPPTPRTHTRSPPAQLGSVFRGSFDFASPPFDWGAGYARPNTPMKDLVIYEGLEEKVPHLAALGVNAVELLPVFEFDELEFQRSKNPRDHMINVWGYSHLSFFAPMSRFASRRPGGAPPGAAAAAEFKSMVRALHGAGIEVILDVVYNHTAEGGDDDPYLLSWRGIDAAMYYQQDPDAYVKLLNYSGCGNTGGWKSTTWTVSASTSRPASVATAACKLIAEPWDIGMYQVGTFPNWDVWAEWNGIFRDDVRRFIRGDAGMKSAFATRLAGSADLYHNHNRKPYHSLNFVIAHDGFTLADLVSYNQKHNEANGEGGRDGTNDNYSWNCGASAWGRALGGGALGGERLGAVEGPADNPAVLALRQKQQMRNLHLALMLSQGTPMVLAGDEYASSRGGNNNWYGHDTPLTHFDWEALEGAKKSGWFRFYSSLIKLRREHPLLGRADFLGDADVTWHEDRWDDPESRFLAFTLHDRGQGCGDLYAAFNTHSFEARARGCCVVVRVALPPPPPGRRWCRLADTALPPPRDFTPGGNAGVEPTYGIQAYSAILLTAKPAEGA
eukprot:scaffold5.g861.t1